MIDEKEEQKNPPLIEKTVVLVGMMGSGKSSVGWRLAQRLSMPFFDSDREVEKAAGCSVLDIYDRWGERAFRTVEQKVIQRLLAGPIHVLSTGDGSFLSPVLRSLILNQTISVWLKADITTIYNRVKKKQTRPQLVEGDSWEILEEMLAERSSTYSLADLTVESQTESHARTVERLMEVLKPYRSDC